MVTTIWTDLAYQLTRRAWFSGRAYEYENKLPDERAVFTKKRLLDDLAELAEGTTVMGKPDRVTPRFGVIADHKKGTSVPPPYFPEQALHKASSSINHTAPTQIEIKAPIPIVPIPLLQPSFEVRAYSSVLPASLANLCTLFDEPRSDSEESTVCDENEPPIYLFQEDRKLVYSEASTIPEPQHRGERKPFAVLHYDPDNTPVEEWKGSLDKDVLQNDEKHQILQVFCKGGPQVQSGEARAKGWARLRPKAPPAIDISLTDAALRHERGRDSFLDLNYSTSNSAPSTIDIPETDTSSLSKVEGRNSMELTNAPMMLNVPLPPVTPSVHRLLQAADPADKVALIPEKVPILPLTARRIQLLNILNGVPQVAEEFGYGV